MSKHPIPDWLRSQFSRIEDEVHKLGPCGVFTQMRTVTQTYFEQAAAPQPPALGGEVEVLAVLDRHAEGGVTFSQAALSYAYHGTELVDRAHYDAQQAEIERLKVQLAALTNAATLVGDMLEKSSVGIEQLKARNAELEGLLLLIRDQPSLNPVHRARIKSALSTTAGSESV